MSATVLALTVSQTAAPADDAVPETAEAVSAATIARIELNEPVAGDDELTGRVLVRFPDGSLLLEARSGRLHQLTPRQVAKVVDTDKSFARYSRDEMAAELIRQTEDTFTIHRTENFVVCSDSSQIYTQFVGRLLEKVVDEYQEFFAKSGLSLTALPQQLPVIIFRNATTFQEFANAQHPGTDFSDVPGYYSVEHNQTLIAAVSGDREFRSRGALLRALKKNLRHVETIVHETVHQLTFNTGVMVRYADNPVWLSEGLSVYFEHASDRGSLLWSRPGGINRIHLPGFNATAQEDRLRLPLNVLCGTDETFQSAQQLADSYAESWALVYYLLQNERSAFFRLLAPLGKLEPLQRRDSIQRLSQLQTATGKTADELERELIRVMKTVRIRK